MSLGLRAHRFAANLALCSATLGLALLAACGGGGGSTPPSPPVISSFTSAKSTITSGTSTTLSAVFANGNGTLDHGLGPVTPGVAVTVSPAVDTTYTLTVTSPQGLAAARKTTVTVVAPPVTPVVIVPANVTAGQAGYTASVPAQEGCTYAWSITGGTLLAGGTTATVAFTPGASGNTQLSCVATNAAGTPSSPGIASTAIVPPPTITAFAANPSTVVIGSGSVLTYAFSGGTGVIDQGIGSVATGGSTNIGPTSSTAYILTVTNPAGTSVAATTSLTVTVPPAPTIQAFTAQPAVISRGEGTLLTFDFSNGTGVLDHGIGPVASGGTVAVSPVSDTTYTLTVTNAVGVATTASLAVTVKSFVSKFVYVANGGGGITGFTLDDGTGAMTPLAGSPFDPSAPTLHVTSDPQGRFLFAVNGDGVANVNTLSIYAIDSSTGDLTPVASNPTVPTGTDPWCAAVDPSGQYVYVRCDGEISCFRLNGMSGLLTPLAGIPTSGGSGDLVVHPSGKYLFTVGRTSDRLEAFEIDPLTGALTREGSPYVLPSGTGPLGLALSNTGEFLFTKGEGASGGPAVNGSIYGYHVDIATGGLTPLGALVTGLVSADAYHGLTFNPAQSVLYGAFETASYDAAAYAFSPGAGAMTPVAGSPYAWFGGNGSDQVVLSRNGKWALVLDYNGQQVALGSVDGVTGGLTFQAYAGGQLFPVSATVVGVLQ